MSITSGVPTSIWSSESPQSKTPQGQLVDFLVSESSRYISLPHIFGCDAIFVHRWFEDNIFGQISDLQSQHPERLFELMNPGHISTTVMGIKLLQVNRNNDFPDRFRLRWSKYHDDCSEVFLVSCFGLSDHVAVIPRSYLITRYGDTRNIEAIFELDQACPSLLAPFMVHYRDLVGFLEKIFEHASTSATSDLINPTYSATYHCWMPELLFLDEIMPVGAQLDKLRRMRELYFACPLIGRTMRLSRRGEPGHFMLDGYAIEYYRRSWCRVGMYREYLRITLRHQVSVKTAWKFLFLEDHSGKAGILLPRSLVPPHLIGHARHGRHDNVDCPQVEVAAAPLTPYHIPVHNPPQTVTAMITVMRNHTYQAGVGCGRSLGDRDSGYEGSIPHRTRSGMEDWILDLLHKEP